MTTALPALSAPNRQRTSQVRHTADTSRDARPAGCASRLASKSGSATSFTRFRHCRAQARAVICGTSVLVLETRSFDRLRRNNRGALRSSYGAVVEAPQTALGGAQTLAQTVVAGICFWGPAPTVNQN